jgi:3',5'-nucleoside bisphosphate phosphatase
MVKCYYDCHIHSALSPCGDEWMSPQNIVNMAVLKALDIIAITDHHSAKNCEVIKTIGEEKGLQVICGMEVESIEGIHFICLFETVSAILQFQKIIDKHLPNLSNPKNILGEQLIFNADDEKIGEETQLLLTSSNLKMNELINLVHQNNGLIFAAHVNKQKNSLFSVLGFMPKNSQLDGIEVSNHVQVLAFKEKYQLNDYSIIQNSDAHYLGDISERNNYLELEERSIAAFFNHFRRGFNA